MKETELKELLKEAFEAGRDYQYIINPYSGKPSMFSEKPSFTKWYNAKLKSLDIAAVVGRSEQYFCCKTQINQRCSEQCLDCFQFENKD